MDRGLRAQLSPNEESTLRRISGSPLDQQQLRPGDLGQLTALNLIELRMGAWHLTPLGEQRVNALPSALPPNGTAPAARRA